MFFTDSQVLLKRDGNQRAPFIINLPLAGLGLALVYLAVALPIAWDTSSISIEIASQPPPAESGEEPAPAKVSNESETETNVTVPITLGPINWYFGPPQSRRQIANLLQIGGEYETVVVYALICAGIGLVLLTAFALGFVRHGWSLRLIRGGYFLGYLAGAGLAVAAWQMGSYLEAEQYFGDYQPRVARFLWWCDLTLPLALLMLGLVLVHIYSWKAAVIHLYTGQLVADGAGDRILENVRTGGVDPKFRRSWTGSILAHIFFLIVLPFLLSLYGCVEDYRVPKGSGNPVVAMVQFVQPKKVERKTYILNPKSPISFHVPTLEDDSEVQEQITQLIERPYEASNAKPGRMGAGGGTQGGWPDGMENAEVRFIRLSYGGRNWDDGMGQRRGRADMNFLDEFHRQTGFKIRNHSESHPIHYLAKYRKGYAPPFVYMTGDGGIGAKNNDIAILRNYLEGGGMLFADAGIPTFHHAFISFMKRVFPGKQLSVIADDDPLFLVPYRFQNGPPPLWHHGGSRCMGIKHKGRWCVFYHPGDINDAWKTGHSGIDAESAQGAYQLGINIIYYSFTNYLRLTRQYRK